MRLKQSASSRSQSSRQRLTRVLLSMLGSEYIRVFAKLISAPPLVICMLSPMKKDSSHTILSKGKRTSPCISECRNTALMSCLSFRSSSLPWKVQLCRSESCTVSSSTTRMLHSCSSDSSSTVILVAKTPRRTRWSLDLEMSISPAVTDMSSSQSERVQRLITTCFACEFSSWSPRMFRPSRWMRSIIISERQSPSFDTSSTSTHWSGCMTKASRSSFVNWALACPGSR
mmetsp:Transcript_71309/g.186976  ORF Transcript_71309/g.186976 Transcript_71309/m.186976 type:complete len:229 (+) Transcript_71309:89-775(+)